MAIKTEIAHRGWHEAWGILLLALCLLLFLSLVSYTPDDLAAFKAPPNQPPLNFVGPVGARLGYALFMLAGLAAYLIPTGLGLFGVFLIFKREGRLWPKALWIAALIVLSACLFDLHGAFWQPAAERLNLRGFAGGMLGYQAGRELLREYLGGVGAFILILAVFAIGLIFLFEISLATLARRIGAAVIFLRGRWMEWRKKRMDRQAALELEAREVARQRRRLERLVKDVPAAAPADVRPEPVPPPVEIPAAAAPPEPVPAVETPPEPAAAPRVKPRVPAPAAELPAKPPAEEPAAAPVWQLPPITKLNPPAAGAGTAVAELQNGAQVLEDTMTEFGVEAKVTNVEVGPVVTRYELLPAAGVRVERITGLSNNIALSMRAESVRIQAPIPGKGVVGIEVPNQKTTMVFEREVIESEVWQSGQAALPLALGKDVGGRVIVADLADMPHLLIAGATGAGKTVCMNSLLAGLLMTRTPDQLRLMLIDPKIVEFSGYNKIPHLVVPVITEAKKVSLGLRWAINEMQRRYALFGKVGVRNIKAFNSRPKLQQTELFGAPPKREDDPPDRLPYIVIVVDELADLMLVARAEIENQIARLAQLSRATGIHMILATQRPSVNVITGTIKANFPARIAFQVAQKVDSRTILDTIGADKLLGKGDMLFLPPGSSKLIRAQGCYTSDQELRDIVEFWRAQGEPQYEISIKEKMDKVEARGDDLPDTEEDDELIEQSIEIIRQTRRASTSSLQRRLRIGYTRAARIMDLLEERGIVGPAQGSDPREILIDLDGEIPANPGAGPADDGEPSPDEERAPLPRDPGAP